MNRIVLVFGITIFIFMMDCGCSRPGNPVLSGGGKGGTGKLLCVPQFSTYFIDTFTAYIKYGTLDAPANGKYDDSGLVQVIGGVPMVVFDSLKTGIYYVYGIGYHTDPSHYPNLKGGLPITLPKEESLTQYIPVAPYNP